MQMEMVFPMKKKESVDDQVELDQQVEHDEAVPLAEVVDDEVEASELTMKTITDFLILVLDLLCPDLC